MEEVVIQVDAPASWDIRQVQPRITAELHRVMQERGANSCTNQLTCGGRLNDNNPNMFIWHATYQIG